jgi:hypothetical protein
MIEKAREYPIENLIGIAAAVMSSVSLTLKNIHP